MHLGVDAGNSKTLALVCRSDGRVVGTGRGGCGDIYGVPDSSDATAAVLAAIGQAMAEGGIQPAGIKTAAFRLAGVDWPDDLGFWKQTLERELPELDHASILNDGFAPIRCGEPSGTAVAVVVGTGHAIAGRGPTGAEWALSWWALDRLGAAGLGHEALRAACRQTLGLGPATLLTRALLETYKQDTIEAVLCSFTRRVGSRPWQDHGKAARQVLAAARAGDRIAREIIDRHAHQLTKYARLVAGKAGFDPETETVPIVLAGSVVMADDSPMTTALNRELVQQIPRCRPIVSAMPPVAGAVLDAIAEAGMALTEDILAALKDTLPEIGSATHVNGA